MKTQNKYIQLMAVALSIFALTEFAQARIGETLAQCSKRYGRPVSTSGEVTVYRMAGFLVMVSTHQGVVDRILYRKEAENVLGVPADISKDEIKMLLKSNAPTWEVARVAQIGNWWRTPSESLLSMWTPAERHLIVTTEGWLERRRVKEKDEAARVTKGF